MGWITLWRCLSLPREGLDAMPSFLMTELGKLNPTLHFYWGWGKSYGRLNHMASLILFALEQKHVHIHTLLHMFVCIYITQIQSWVFLGGDFFLKLQRQAHDRDARIQAVCASALKHNRTFSWEKLTQTPWKWVNCDKYKRQKGKREWKKGRERWSQPHIWPLYDGVGKCCVF